MPLGSEEGKGWVSLIWAWAGCGWKPVHCGGQGPGGLEMYSGRQGGVTSQLCPIWQIFWGRKARPPAGLKQQVR